MSKFLLPEGRKCQMVKSQTESHIRRPIVGRSGFSFPLRFAGGRLEFVMQALGDSSKLSKGQLISECLFDFPKFPPKFDRFLPWKIL